MAKENVLKHAQNVVEMESVTKDSFYAIIEVKSKNKVVDEDGSEKLESVSKRMLKTFKGTRKDAKEEFNAIAKAMKGNITYFGAFKN